MPESSGRNIWAEISIHQHFRLCFCPNISACPSVKQHRGRERRTRTRRNSTCAGLEGRTPRDRAEKRREADRKMGDRKIGADAGIFRQKYWGRNICSPTFPFMFLPEYFCLPLCRIASRTRAESLRPKSPGPTLPAPGFCCGVGKTAVVRPDSAAKDSAAGYGRSVGTARPA